MYRVVLASASPRRAALLQQAGIAIEVRPSRVEECRVEGESARDYVLRLAGEKAAAVAEGCSTEGVLAADTVVVLDGDVLEKPVDECEARSMLQSLSGRRHQVLTGFCYLKAEQGIEQVVETEVEFRSLSAVEIETYLQTGEPYDKAGGYGIQSGAAHMVRQIHGSYTNVVGLPMAEVMTAITSLDA